MCKASFLQIILFLIFPVFFAEAQITQTIRGKVEDKHSREALIGATVVLIDSTVVIGSATDVEGNFRLDNVPIGRKTIKVSYIGYNDVVLNNLILTSAKELVLRIEMEEKILKGEEIVVEIKRRKDKPLNDMATVSARKFTIEETQRYAGTLNDPARMAANFAGVTGANDQRNDIIIRGNSPIGVLWRLDNVDIPNPNHFGAQGTTGGPISILNNNLLDNSDFMTGAFPAEYGNALAGVFDLRMRKGNDEQHEFLGQIGMNGVEFLAEGPFSKRSKASYIASYRYSTLQLFDLLGIQFGVSGIPAYQDLSFKVAVPTKKAGEFSLFGIGGISDISILDSERDTTDWTFGQTGNDIIYGSSMGVIALSHDYRWSRKAYTRLIFSATRSINDISVDSIDQQTLNKFNTYDQFSRQDKYNTTLIYNRKLSARHTVRAGMMLDYYSFNMADSAYVKNLNRFNVITDFDGGAHLVRGFAQWKYRLTNELGLISGGYYQRFLYNNARSLEPRVGLRWNFKPNQNFNLGYGIHSQLQPFSIYFLDTGLDDRVIKTNKNLGFTKSQHLIAGYDYAFSKNLRLKAEAYYQKIANVPVEQKPSTFSMLNAGADFGISNVDSLVNKGKGSNYGLEVTLEKFFSNNYYFLVTGSLYEAKYTGSNGREFNSVFNGRYTFNMLGGGEFNLGSKNKKEKTRRSITTISIDGKITMAGGKRYTPYEIVQLAPSNYIRQYDDSRAYSEQFKDYFRADIRIGIKRNGEKITQTWAFDIQNVFNTKNILTQEMDTKSGIVRTEYQLGLFPVALYRINF